MTRSRSRRPGPTVPIGGAVGLAVALLGETAWAHHDLRQGIDDLFGPNAWALYLIVLVPYVLFGLLGYRIYKAVRAADAERGDDEGGPKRELNSWPKER